ncbi:MAG: NACHT domain-containing protein [Nitrosotalea sp.]
MQSKAFVSHTESGGRKTGSIIYTKLKRPEIDMDAFLSNETMGPTDNLTGSILKNIIDTELFILVIDSASLSSSWIEWEHDFCRNRNVISLYVVFPSMYSKLNSLSYLDFHNIRINYDDYDPDVLQDKIAAIIFTKQAELESHAAKRNAITITANHNNTSYRPSETVIINGNVQNNNTNTASYNSKIYLHVPSTNPKFPPQSTLIVNTFTVNPNGDFNASIILPSGPETTQIQKWYIEIRINEKSTLIPIEICPPNDTSSTILGGPSSGSPTVSSSSDESLGLGVEINLTDVTQKFKIISEGTLQSIPRKIKDSEIMRKEEVTNIISRLDSDDRIVITGDKGSGKSVLLCQLYEKLTNIYENILFIRCDDFLGINSVNDLEKIVDNDLTISKIVNNLPNNAKTVILFDSLDAISRNTKSIGLFKQFLKSLWGTKRVKTICSVRSYDYEYSPLISTTDWGFPVNLDELSDTDLENTLNRLGDPIIPSSLKKILKNPLRLKLLSMILEKKRDADFSKVTNEIELYNEHWKEYVEKQENPIATTKILFDIAKKMTSVQKIILPTTMLEDSTRLYEISSRGIIKTSNDQIQFFHHAYLDYVLSKFIIQNYSNIVEFLKEDEYNVFLRPTIEFTLSLLHNINKKRYLDNILKIYKSNLKYYWKISALKSLSEGKDFDIDEVMPIGALLTDDLILQRHFLIEVSKVVNPFWFRIWSDSFLINWYSKETGNGRFLVDYLNSVRKLADLPEKILYLARVFVAKKEYPMNKREAIRATAEIKDATKVEWYQELSKHPESLVRSGVLSCLPSLLETKPEVVPDIFSNIFVFEEKSDENTSMLSYGTLGFTSTKKQDNRQVIWEAGENFPKLFQKNPKQMTKATIEIFENIYKKYLDESNDRIVEDYDYVWYDVSGFSEIHDENKLISTIEEYLNNCTKETLKDFISILKSTRLALFHKILLNNLSKNFNYFKDEIFEEISQPKILKIQSLDIPVRNSINKICKLLNPDQNRILLQNIMELKFDKKDFNNERYLKTLNKIKAKFLSEFDESLLNVEHKQIIANFSKKELVSEPPVKFSFTMEEARVKPIEKIPLEELIESNIEKKLDHNEKIELLESMVEYLGRKTGEIDKVKLSKISKYIISLRCDEDPEESVVDKDPSFMLGHHTIRGLVARGIIRIFYHTKNTSFSEMVSELSKDKINIVRGDVARELSYLFFVDYPLTLEITNRYSQEVDPRVQFFLNDVIRYIVGKNSEDAIKIIQNILSISSPKSSIYIRNVEGPILHLALKKNNVAAKQLLDKIIESEEYETEIRRSIPFILKENYLFDPDTQDSALDIFLKLLDAEDPEVREGATFFLLYPIEKNKIDDLPALINKIKIHLDKIANEIDRKPWHPKIIETLTHFLEEYWNYMPEKTLDYLEKISSVKEYSPFQPIFAHGTINVLNGIFQLPLLSKNDRNRSLAILDIFAMAGWPEALTLLSVMERPD